MVMKSAEDGHRYDAACVLDGAMDRSILLERRIASEALNGKALASCYLRRLTLALSARRLNWLCSTMPSLTLRRPQTRGNTSITFLANSIAAAFEGLTEKVLRLGDCIPGIARSSKRLTLANHLRGHSSKASIR